MAKADEQLTRGGIRLRQFGQEIIEALGGQKIHPAWVAPGGVRAPLSMDHRDKLRDRLPEAMSTTQTALGLMKQLLDKYPEEIASFGNFKSLYLGLVAEDGSWEQYGGRLRFADSDGQIIADQIDPAKYRDYIGEKVESYSYLKSPYYIPLGYPKGIYRVGPLARVNIADRMGTPIADKEQQEFKQRGQDAASSSFYYHYARLVEVVCCLEKIEQLLDDPEIMKGHYRATAGVNQNEGVGCSEAPRGTLFHHYHVDDDGKILKCNLIIATGQNNLAMNQTVLQIAKHYIDGPEIPEGILNRLEAGVRAFDPCLSCSTHAAGQMPLSIQLMNSSGIVIDTKRRNEHE